MSCNSRLRFGIRGGVRDEVRDCGYGVFVEANQGDGGWQCDATAAATGARRGEARQLGVAIGRREGQLEMVANGEARGWRDSKARRC
jgi:hypothetical protein